MARTMLAAFNSFVTTLSNAAALCTRHRRRAMGVKTFDRLQAPGLPLLPLGLGPGNGLPVGCQDQPGAGVGDFDPVARRLPDIKKKGLLDRMLVRTGFDMHTVLQKDIGRLQNV